MTKQDNLRSYIHNIAENGGDINKKDKYGCTPLFYYTHEGRIDTDEYYETVKLCFELGADPNDMSSYRDPILEELHTVAFIGKLFSVAKEEPYCNEYPDKTKLNKALIRLVDLAAEYGADMNAPGGIEGKRALYFADSPELISALLRHGADPNLPCASYYLKEYLRIPLTLAISFLDLTKAELLLEAGANINTDPPPFHVLLGRINPDPYNEDKIDPKTISEFIKLFIQYGVNLEAKDKLDRTVFEKSCCKYKEIYRRKYRETEKMNLIQFMFALAEYGADINVLTKEGVPAIKLLPKKLQKEIKDRVKYIRMVEDMTNCDSDFYER